MAHLMSGGSGARVAEVRPRNARAITDADRVSLATPCGCVGFHVVIKLGDGLTRTCATCGRSFHNCKAHPNSVVEGAAPVERDKCSCIQTIEEMKVV